MTVTINHTTPADGTFSTQGAAAWDAAHAVSGLGTMAEQNANNVNITGGSISGVSGIGTVTSVAATAGTGISVTGSPITSSGTLNITNTAPDQTVVLNAGTGISTSGTYPNFTVTNTAPDQVVSLTAGTNITVTGTYPSFTIAASGGGGSMVYPSGTGIAVVTGGTSWGTTLTAPSGAIVGTTDTQTLSNKTLTGTKETVFAITDGAAFEIDPANGGIQTITLGANRTPKGTNFTAGQSVTLMVTASTYTLTWTDATFGASGVNWTGGFAPTLSSTGISVIELWEVGTQVYGALVGFN